MNWIYLIFAIIMEVLGTTMMKLTNGFTKLIPSVLMFVFYLGSLSFLTFALKRIEVGTAYAIWSGFGTALITIFGIVFFKENISIAKVVSITLIIMGVVGLNLSGGTH